MNLWTVYDIETGLLRQRLVDANGPLDDLQPGQSFVSGHYDWETNYVLNGEVISRPEMPVVVVSNNAMVFRIVQIPVGTVVSFDDQEIIVNDGFFELASVDEDQISVTLQNFPYLKRVIDAIFAA